MIVGTICYAANSGLGHLAKMFFEQGILDRILVIPHPHYSQHLEWYPPEKTYFKETAEEFLRNLDIIFAFENPFDWRLVRVAKDIGIKLVVMPMYEYSPFPPPITPDLVICPSLLDVDYYKNYKNVFIPVPVDIEWHLRERARIFIHNAGHGGRGFRNGTPELIQAMRYVESPIKLIIRGQPEEGRIKELFSKGVTDDRIELVMGEIPKDEDLWKEGDVYIAPEKFNGLSLPLQKARAAGMVVMTTNRYPMNTWLPPEPLLSVARYERDKISVEFDRAIVSPLEIARMIDAWYDKDIIQYSLSGRLWAKKHTWEVLKPQYMQILENLL